MPRNFFHPPTRSEALDRVARFASRAGGAYAAGRNTDVGPDEIGHVSKLSPYVRRRLVTETEVVAQVLMKHSPAACEKFVQEVLWRTYWQGWLEMRPGAWRRFLDERDRKRDPMAGLAASRDAESGGTGIEGFDDRVAKTRLFLKKFNALKAEFRRSLLEAILHPGSRLGPIGR